MLDNFVNLNWVNSFELFIEKIIKTTLFQCQEHFLNQISCTFYYFFLGTFIWDKLYSPEWWIQFVKTEFWKYLILY